MKIIDFYNLLDSLYPRSLSCEWDNDGIMCSADVNNEIKKVMISLDATDEAVKTAADQGCDLLLTHHPMLFRSPKAVINNDYLGNRIISALKFGVTVISLHTRLDAGDDGVNDRLVKALGFETAGKFGDGDAPTLGRFIELEGSVDSAEIARLCKEKLDCHHIRMTGKGNTRRIAVVGGAGGDFIKPALSIGAGVLITGECSYNAAQDAYEDGLVVIEAGHYKTEFPVCLRFAEICSSCGLSFDLFDSHIYNFF